MNPDLEMLFDAAGIVARTSIGGRLKDIKCTSDAKEPSGHMLRCVVASALTLLGDHSLDLTDGITALRADAAGAIAIHSRGPVSDLAYAAISHALAMIVDADGAPPLISITQVSNG